MGAISFNSTVCTFGQVLTLRWKFCAPAVILSVSPFVTLMYFVFGATTMMRSGAASGRSLPFLGRHAAKQ